MNEYPFSSYYSVARAAEILGLDEAGLEDLIARHDLFTLWIGATRVVSADPVRAIAEAQAIDRLLGTAASPNAGSDPEPADPPPPVVLEPPPIPPPPPRVAVEPSAARRQFREALKNELARRRATVRPLNTYSWLLPSRRFGGTEAPQTRRVFASTTPPPAKGTPADPASTGGDAVAFDEEPLIPSSAPNPNREPGEGRREDSPPAIGRKQSRTIEGRNRARPSFRPHAPGLPHYLPIEQSPALGLLSTRTRNCLEREGVSHVAELAALGEWELLAIPSFGARCLAEVENFLAAHRLPERQQAYDGPSRPGADEVSRPSTLREILAFLSEHAWARSSLDAFVWQRPTFASGVLEELQDLASRQIEAGTLDDLAVMDWGPLVRMSADLTPVALSLGDLIHRAQYASASEEPEGRTLWPARPLEMLVDALGNDLKADLDLLMGGLDGRARKIVRERTALKRRSYGSLGEEFGVTHERIRQIYLRSAEEIRARYKRLPLARLRTAMLAAAACPDRTRGGVSKLLEKLSILPAGAQEDDTSLGDLFGVWKAIDPDLRPFPEGIDF